MQLINSFAATGDYSQHPAWRHRWL